MPVNLHAEEVTLVLPVEFALQCESATASFGNRVLKAYVGDIEQVLLAEDGPRREVDDGDAGRLVYYLGSPVSKHVLLGLLASSDSLLSILLVLVALRTPLKVDDALDLDTLLVVQTHARQLVYTNLLPRSDTANKLVICTPLECRPLHLALDAVLALRHRGGEGTEEVAGLVVPDSNVVALIFWRKVLWALLGTLGDMNGIV